MTYCSTCLYPAPCGRCEDSDNPSARIADLPRLGLNDLPLPTAEELAEQDAWLRENWLSEHTAVRREEKFFCRRCGVKWPCLAKQREALMEMTTDQGPDVEVRACRSCGKPIYWGITAAGKRCPYDITDGVATTVSHFATCPDAAAWSKPRRKPK